jgi:protein tyrosine phosphatase (PTP) superfamily phosphohydrolase (DUF442 family)
MLNPRSFRTRFGRAAPPARAHPRLALLTLAVLGLLVEGCASLGGNPCGGGGGCGLLRKHNFRLRNPFRRDVIVTDPCGEPGLGVPVEGVPAVIPGAVIPAPAAPATPAEEMPQLEPAPSSSATTPTTGQTSPNRRTLYETQKPPGGTTTSRREAPAPLATAARPAPGDEPVIDLPPLSAPAATPEDSTPPVPPPAEAVQAELPPRPAEAQPVSLADGIARFKVVEPQLAAGSVPSAAGWAFLVEKGYRTVLDLRPRAEVQPGDDAAASHVGLLYVNLPLTPEMLNEALVTRFEDEISRAGSRPLYFFDADGSRPAALWRLHLLARGTPEADADAAVAEIGPIEPKLRDAMTRLLAARKPKSAAAEPTPTAVVEPAAPTPTAAVPAIPAPLPSLPVARTAPPSEPVPTTDPTAWRPYAAMLLTGLSVPLAYFGRTVLGSVSLRRASLPAPATRPKALPASSGE